MVEVGLTLVEPLAAANVKFPGVIEIDVGAPTVAQVSVLLAPELMLLGLAVNELIEGFLPGFTVTVAVDVVEPMGFVAVRV